MAFGVTTVNVFDLLDDENEETDPQTLSKAVAAKVSLKELEKAQAAKSAEPAPRAAVPAPAGRNGGRGDRGRGAGRGRGEGRGRGGYDRPRREEGDLAYDSGSAPTANRGRGRGRGEGRGDRGNGFRGERPARRQYDRHDGTGRGHEYEKRGGAGKGNWGPEGEEAAELKEAVVGEELPDEEVKEAVAEAEIPGADQQEEHVVTEPEPEPEPEVKEMSLEEYEALLEEKRANLNKTRSEAAKVDLEQFKGMKVAEKKEIEEDVVIELSNKKVIGKNKLGSEKPRKEKEVVETGFRVGDEQSFGGRSGGRGGRGEGRGRGRGRFDDERPRYNGGSRDDEGGRRGGRFGDSGGRRGGRPGDEGGRRGGGRFNSAGRGEHTPQIDDVNSFPSLG